MEKAVSIYVIILPDRKVKTFNFTISKFPAQRYEDIWPAKVGMPLREKGEAHADMVSEGFGNSITKGDRPANSRDVNPLARDQLDYRWRENIQRSSPQITGQAKAMTTLRLEKCVFRHTLGARTFYTSPLSKCQKTQRKTFWLLIFRSFNVNRTMNNILSFTKGIFNNQWNLSEEKIGTNFWNTL